MTKNKTKQENKVAHPRTQVSLWGNGLPRTRDSALFRVHGTPGSEPLSHCPTMSLSSCQLEPPQLSGDGAQLASGPVFP